MDLISCTKTHACCTQPSVTCWTVPHLCILAVLCLPSTHMDSCLHICPGTGSDPGDNVCRNFHWNRKRSPPCTLRANGHELWSYSRNMDFNQFAVYTVGISSQHHSVTHMCLLVLTGAGANVWRTHAIVTPGTGGQTGAPLPHPVQLQVEEQARDAGETPIQSRACRTTCWTESANRGATCG